MNDVLETWTRNRRRKDLLEGSRRGDQGRQRGGYRVGVHADGGEERRKAKVRNSAGRKETAASGKHALDEYRLTTLWEGMRDIKRQKYKRWKNANTSGRINRGGKQRKKRRKHYTIGVYQLEKRKNIEGTGLQKRESQGQCSVCNSKRSHANVAVRGVNIRLGGLREGLPGIGKMGQKALIVVLITKVRARCNTTRQLSSGTATQMFSFNGWRGRRGGLGERKGKTGGSSFYRPCAKWGRLEILGDNRWKEIEQLVGGGRRDDQ